MADDRSTRAARGGDSQPDTHSHTTTSFRTTPDIDASDGEGKWRMRMESADQRPPLVFGLVATRDGALHNVSR